MAEAVVPPAEQLGQAIAASAAEAGRGRKRGMTAERVELEKSVFKQRLHDIMLWITQVLGEDVFSAVGALGVAEEWQEVQEKKLVQQQIDDNEKRVIDALENGTVLCKLMETIVPDSCTGFVGLPKTPAACLSNLQAFIVACSQYGVEATFTSLDLFELKNLKTVVSCLNELGKRASKNGFTPSYSTFAPEPTSIEAGGTSAIPDELSQEEDKESAPAESQPAENEERQPEEDVGEDDGSGAEDIDPEEAPKNTEADAQKEPGEQFSGDAAEGEHVSEEAAPKAEGCDDEGDRSGELKVEEESRDDEEPQAEEELKTETERQAEPEAQQEAAGAAAIDESSDESEEYEEEIEEEIIDDSEEEEVEQKTASPADAAEGDAEKKSDEGTRAVVLSEEPTEDAPLPPVGEDGSPQGDMMDILLGLIDDGVADAPAITIKDVAAGDESSADGESVLEVGEKPVTPTRPSKPEALLSPRPEIPSKPASLSPKPAVPRKPQGLLSPRFKPEVPDKPQALVGEEELSEEASDSDDVMEGWNRDDFASKIMELRAELKRERRLREIAEKEVRKLRQEKKGRAGKSLSLSSANMLKKKKARSSSVKGASSDNLRMQLEEKRRKKEAEEAARRELEEARKSKLNTAEQRQRLAVLHEILNTEKSYVDDLKQIQQLHTVLCADDRAATPVELQTVFSNITQILFIHEELTSTFDQRMEQCTVENAWECAVGDIFLKLGDFLKIYTVYVSNQAKQTHVVEDLLQHSRFVSTLMRNMPDVFRAKQSVPSDLRSLLIKPIQRICKYPLLLRELIKSTEEGHPDKENLRKAMEHAESIAAFVNEKRKESEALMKLVHIQESVGDLPKSFKVVTPTRVFIREATMVKISKGRAQERHFYLFNDLLLYAAKRALGGKLMFKGKVLLNTLLVNNLPDTIDRQHTFELVRLDHKKKKYIICAKSEEEKATWMHEMSDLISALLHQANNERKGIQEEQTLTEHESLLASIRFTSDALDTARAEGEGEERIMELQRQLVELKKKIGTDIRSQV